MKVKWKWHRVSRDHRCPICGKPDWCLIAGADNNPEAAICSRVESTNRVGVKGAGWLHRLRDDNGWRDRPRQHRVTSEAPALPTIDFGAMAADCYRALGDDRRGELAIALGVSRFSLEHLGVGWSERHRAFTFPMRHLPDRIVGIRLRCSDGRKLAVKGSRQGLFWPHVDLNDQLVVCEGPTDTAAMLDLSFEAVGRPSCSGGVPSLISIATGNAGDRFGPRDVVIIADDDGPGHRGAWHLASVLVSYVASVRVVTPPDGIKDAREWKRQGATRIDILDAIAAAPALQITYAVQEVTR